MPNPCRVLLVDDDHDQAELALEFLKISGEFRVDWANSVKRIWEFLESGDYDVALMDYRLPDGTGLAALTEMNQRGYHIPVVMVTGQGDERIAVEALRLGAADYLVKSGDHLLALPAVIQKAIRAHQLQLKMQRSLDQIRYQALLLNNVRDAVVVWDTEGNISYWNPAAEGLYGWLARERLGQPVEPAYQSAFKPPVSTPPWDGTTGHEVEREVLTRQGKPIWVSSRVTVLRDPGADGRVIGYMDIARDITERKHMEAQIQTAQSRLTQNARLAAVGELASGVAHHINNPLTAIIAEAQLLLHSLPENHAGRESAETIEKAGWRVQKVVQLLAEFSRPEANNFTEISVNETVENALALVGEQIQIAGVRLLSTLSPVLPRMYGNARQLGDLWLNLLLLARDAVISQPEGRIEICSGADPAGSLYVEIHDNGLPIPPDELRTIFEPNFYKPVGGRGVGIELSLCHEIVRQHQGRIHVQSDPEHGTIFRVIFGGSV